MNILLNIIKIGALYVIRLVLRVFWFIPIDKKKIVFASYAGREYSCNPKYIFEYVYRHYRGVFNYVWAANSPDVMPSEYSAIKTVKYLSFQYVFHVLTAGYIIYNSAIKAYLPVRKSQIIVNTWHGGGAYKKIHLDASPYKKNVMSMKRTRKVSAKAVSFVITSCKQFTVFTSKVWAIPPEKYLPIGLPRNDILFAIPETAVEKARSYFGLDNTVGIVLYAPTFRGDYRKASRIDFKPDIEAVLGALKNKYHKDFIFLYRAHSSSKEKQALNSIDVSKYPDMQELLCAADALITDYSSSVWDFSFTFKPCFLFAPDLEQYKKEQGFYTPIEEWPFPLAETNEQLVQNIIDFDQYNYNAAVQKHHAALGSYEKGTAAKQFCDIVFGDVTELAVMRHNKGRKALISSKNPTPPPPPPCN
jgi:CDP-glycerol glycerophosphotransferase